MKAIGEEYASKFRKDFKQQIMTMIKQVSFRRNEQFHKVYWRDGKLIIMSIELGLRSETQNKDHVVLDLVSCYAEANFNREWLWKRWKAQQCEALVQTTYNKLKASNLSRRK